MFEDLGVIWAHYRGPFYCSLPYEKEIELEPSDVHALMRRAGILSVRFPSARYQGVPCGLYVCRPAGYSLHNLSRQYRSQVQRGLAACEVRRVPIDELLAEGMTLNLDTMRRQGRFDPEFGDPARWKKLVKAIEQSPGVDVTGAYVSGRLSAYLISCQEDGWLHLLYKMSRTEDLGQRTNHALDYSVLSTAALDPAVEVVENGFVPLRPNPGLEQYKRGMGFTVLDSHLAMYFHPWMSRVITSRPVVGAAKSVWKVRPQIEALEAAAKVLEGARITMTNQFPIVSSGVRAEQACQHEGCLKYSRLWRPYPLFALKRAASMLGQEGVRATAAKVVSGIMARTRPQKRSTPRPAGAEEILGLQPGEWVQVRSAEEIRATLDGQGRNRGLGFVPEEMLVHCGQQFRVRKRVEKIFLEESKQNRKLKNTVLLEGVHCQGNGVDCDRQCFLFWREIWLKRVPGPDSKEQRS